ncbi:hypothetical protein C8F04DRAFT_1261869 [Mycena alexandri]|uniref:Uncharacterized protein n=1 Tax=Mycena alexandri TaxID=1745969 RepID=A0AAD6STZ1_9AGAR|nr:hypothetical protein C8F04DRAFT_1261869 [Mycena alexandri]
MHPALRLDGLNNVSSPTDLAHSAAKGSLHSLRRLGSLIRTLSDTDSVLILPVFYANLDPSTIPALPDLDTESEMLPSLDYPIDVSLELWPRVWPWVEFFHEYRDYVSGAGPIDAQVYITWGLLLMGLCEHPPTKRLIGKQPGVNAFCTRAWMFTLDVPERARAEVFAQAQFMLLLGPANPQNIREMMAEAGGTHNRSIRLHEPPLSPRDRSFLRAVMHQDYELSRESLGRVEIKLQPIPLPGGKNDAQAPDSAAVALWTDYSRRVQRSRGTMELHLMAVKEGTANRMRIFPLRSTTNQNVAAESSPPDPVQIH